VGVHICSVLDVILGFAGYASLMLKDRSILKKIPHVLVSMEHFSQKKSLQEMKDKHMGVNYTNLRFCAECPHCDTINEKKTKVNAIVC
jgi:hypothetical protein